MSFFNKLETLMQNNSIYELGKELIKTDPNTKQIFIVGGAIRDLYLSELLSKDFFISDLDIIVFTEKFPECMNGVLRSETFKAYEELPNQYWPSGVKLIPRVEKKKTLPEHFFFINYEEDLSKLHMDLWPIEPKTPPKEILEKFWLDCQQIGILFDLVPGKNLLYNQLILTSEFSAFIDRLQTDKSIYITNPAGTSSKSSEALTAKLWKLKFKLGLTFSEEIYKFINQLPDEKAKRAWKAAWESMKAKTNDN